MSTKRTITNINVVQGIPIYGINTGEQSSQNTFVFGSQNVEMFDHTGEGVYAGQVDGSSGWFTSRTVSKTLDLITEGEIGGLVSGEYIPKGTQQLGQVGWTDVEFEPYQDGAWPECFLRSIYLNDTPIVSEGGYYNFQTVEVAFTHGTPSGIRDGDDFLAVGETPQLEKTRTLNERLYGPDDSDKENPFIYNSKIYAVKNREVSKVRVNIRIPALSWTKRTVDVIGSKSTRDATDAEIEQIGKMVGSKLTFRVRYRPIYSTPIGIGTDLNVAKTWYPINNKIQSEVKGIIRQAYLHPMEIDFTSDPDFDDLNRDDLVGWEVEVTRITTDSMQAHVTNQSYVDSITEIFNNELSYPNSSLISMNFNAEYFSQIPNRAFDIYLQKVKVPTGYDPIKKHYPVDPNTDKPNWDGTFQAEKQWTDNPAWVFYDLLTNKRYGLGKFVNNLTIDKWTLWEIAKYCDTLVPNDEGELEPRFTCNVLINTREEAYQVLKDFASIFRGMIYYGLGNIHAVQDRPKKTIAQFTNSNVENGLFTYTSSSKKTRNTVIIVRYNDKEAGYIPAIEYVEDTEGIRKYGVIEKEITAFGCTSRSQAKRLGRWMLLTELNETEMCQFNIGPEAMALRPGDIVKVSDSNRFASSQGGRTIRANETGVILDRQLTGIDYSSSYLITLTTPTYYYDSSLVDTEDSTTFREDTVEISDIRRPQIQSTGIDPNDSNYVFSDVIIDSGSDGPIYGTSIQYNGGTTMFNPASGLLTGESTWTLLETGRYVEDLYSVVSIKESADFRYSLETLKHRPEKYLSIESGIPIDTAPSYGGSTVAPNKPASVSIVEETMPNTTYTKQLKITIGRPSMTNETTVGYRIYIKRVPSASFGAGSTFDAADMDWGSRPKGDFLWTTVYLSEYNNTDPVIVYLPDRNNSGYIVRVFAVNSASTLSAGYEEDNILVTNHFPVRDIKLHSLRLVGQYIEEDPTDPNWSVSQSSFGHATDKNAVVTFDTSYPNTQFSNLEFYYKIRIHTVNSAGLTPNMPALGDFIIGSSDGNVFNFSFSRNLSTVNGPYRHYDLSVIAVDIDGNTSDYSPGGGNYSTQGWDIIEVENPRPRDYFLTPRTDVGRPGKQCSYSSCGMTDVMTTDQYMDAQGNVVLDIMQTTVPDLAGGYIYLSAQPFSGGADGDFDQYNEPDNYSRTYLKLTEEEFDHRSGQFQIIKIPFDLEDSTNSKAPRIIVHPDSVGSSPFEFNLNTQYYMAVKFYDSFDKATKDYYEADPVNRSQYGDWDDDLYLGFVRHTTGSNGQVLTKQYKMYENPYTTNIGDDCCFTGAFLADTDNGTPQARGMGSELDGMGSGIFSCPLAQKKYTSANLEGGFKYWIRINVNGQWEGHGIHNVKTLTQKDVDEYYQYDGFFEYSCVMSEYIDGNGYHRPNHSNSISRCRFRQGKKGQGVGNNYQTLDVDQDIYVDINNFPNANYIATGAVRMPNANTVNVGQKAGVHLTSQPQDDDIPSYNHRGDLIANADRPLYGYRRFRVYFDPYNLPPTFKPNGLASYSVVGVNAWNGPYESWPGSNNQSALTDNIFFAKDGTGIFTEVVKSWMDQGDLFENIPGVWNHHPAGFGQGFGGLIKERTYFDVHLGRMIDDSYLNEAFFGVVTHNDYSIVDQSAYFHAGSPDLHDSTYSATSYVFSADGQPYQNI
jgi:hypothetical protein